MRVLFRTGFVVSAMALVAPALAQSITAFDGTYAGVSEVTDGTRSCGGSTPVPNPLIIANGAARFVHGLDSKPFDGSVDVQGNLKMKDEQGHFLFGKIDSGGKIVARSSGSTGHCVLQWTWQK